MNKFEEHTLNEILSKLKWGRSLTKDEKNFIAYKLDAYDDSEELARALRAFGLAYSASNENIRRVEKYLDSKSDIVLSGAILALCDKSYWGLAGNYIERLKGFLKKEDAYELSDTQVVVLSIMGHYLNSSGDAELYEFLYEMFVKELEEYKNDRDYFQEIRLEGIYHCLDVGIRGRTAQLEYRVGRMKLPDDIDEEIMMDIVKIIRRNK